MNSITEYNQLMFFREKLASEVAQLIDQREEASQLADIADKAKLILQTAAESLQNQLKDALESLCTSALNDVFPEKNLAFRVVFNKQKVGVSVDMFIEEDGVLYDPLESRGHGMADLLTFALRVSVLVLRPQLHKILLLDEPFTRISEEFRGRAISFLKDVADKTGIQIILVTHIPELTESADRVFHVAMKDNISKVEVKYG